MAILSIRQYPDPVLRVECRPVEAFDQELEKLVHDMVETMYRAPGIGLAAPQVGVEKRLFVIDLTVGEEEGNLIVMANPQILESSGSSAETEGCLSIQDFTEKVTRPERVVLRAQKLDGSVFEIEADGLLARAIQHENDHLDGVLFPDRLRGLRREKARRYLKKLQQESLLLETVE